MPTAAAKSILRNRSSPVSSLPRRTHPSTRLIEEVFASIAALGGCGACRKIIVADGVKVREENKFRSGVVTADAEAAYRHYLHRVRALTRNPESSLYGAQLMALDERHGFAHALRRGLMRVETPFVLVAQHDRSFVRATDVCGVVRAMRARNAEAEAEVRLDANGTVGTSSVGIEPTTSGSNGATSPTSRRVNYVGFPTSTTITHAHHMRSKHALELDPHKVTIPVPPPDATNPGSNPSGDVHDDKNPREIRLCPLVQFYDSMHVASTRWYLSRVFGVRRYCNMPRGGFIEDTLGQHMLAVVRGPEGLAAHADFGVFLYEDDTGETKCGHIDGHDPMTVAAECRKFGFARRHTAEETWTEIEGDRGAAAWEEETPVESVTGFLDPRGSARLPSDVQL